MKQILLFFFTILQPIFLLAQQSYPQNYFRSPVGIPIELAGNFGELRPNHFHAGIDITTHGKEGLSIYAAADGYVSRIKVGPFGYGRVLYITHPNGFVTVYGHCSSFAGKIATYVKTQQYTSENFEGEWFPKPEELPVTQSQVIALSGNTGGSSGPHLHFEIRDAKTEEALNPLLFGMPVKDNVKPTVVALAVYPLRNSQVNGKTDIVRIPLKLENGVYVFANPKDSLRVSGRVGFAIDAFDKENLPTGKNGVYAISLSHNNKTIYHHHLERIPFDKMRYINCVIDYKAKETTNKYWMRSWKFPNNELPIYDTMAGDGTVMFVGDSMHQFRYRVADAYGNVSVVKFKVHGVVSKPISITSVYKPFIQIMRWDTTNVFEEVNLYRFEMPSKSVYDNGEFSTASEKGSKTMFSPILRIGDRYEPMHKASVLWIKANVPPEWQSKALIVEVNPKGGYSSVGGKWEDGGVKTEIKEFGKYAVMIDTVAPISRPANFDLKGKVQTNFTALKSVQFTVGDNLSGLASYRCTIDGKWVLLEYEPKKRLLWYTFDERVAKGKHALLLELTDKCGNTTSYTKDFVR